MVGSCEGWGWGGGGRCKSHQTPADGVPAISAAPRAQDRDAPAPGGPRPGARARACCWSRGCECVEASHAPTADRHQWCWAWVPHPMDPADPEVVKTPPSNSMQQNRCAVGWGGWRQGAEGRRGPPLSSCTACTYVRTYVRAYARTYVRTYVPHVPPLYPPCTPFPLDWDWGLIPFRPSPSLSLRLAHPTAHPPRSWMLRPR